MTLTVTDERVELWGAEPVQWDEPLPAVVSVPAEAPEGIPASVPSDQLYYWTHKWQADQAESEEQLREGNSRVFESGAEAVRWLLASTDND